MTEDFKAMNITVKAAPPSTCPCRHCQNAPTKQEITQGWMVTNCACCGQNPVFVRDNDPLNEDIVICEPCYHEVYAEMKSDAPPSGPSTDSAKENPMNIPEEAVEAAAKALAELEPGEDWPSNIDLGGHALLGTRDDEFKRAMEQDAKRALTAALPHIEAALRKQIATDIRDNNFTYISGSTWNSAVYQNIEQAATIAEEGTLE